MITNFVVGHMPFVFVFLCDFIMGLAKKKTKFMCVAMECITH